MDIQSTLASQAYAGARNAVKPDEAPQSGGFAQLANDMIAQMKSAEQTSGDVLMGRADPHAMVEALAATELAVETAVTLRDKVVEAYQEILRMPV